MATRYEEAYASIKEKNPKHYSIDQVDISKIIYSALSNEKSHAVGLASNNIVNSINDDLKLAAMEIGEKLSTIFNEEQKEPKSLPGSHDIGPAIK